MKRINSIKLIILSLLFLQIFSCENPKDSYVKGNEYLESKKCKLALKEFIIYSKENSKFSNVYYKLHLTHMCLGDTISAINDLKILCEKIDKSNVRACYKISKLYFLQSDYLNALDYCNLAIKRKSKEVVWIRNKKQNENNLDVNSVILKKLRAKIYYKLSDYEKAYQDAIFCMNSVHWDYKEVYSFLGQCSLNLGNPEKAYFYLTEAKIYGNFDIQNKIDSLQNLYPNLLKDSSSIFNNPVEWVPVSASN